MRIGIDLGGTKIAGVALDDAGIELARRRIPAPREYQDTLRALVGLVEDLERVCGRRGTVGVGTPGALSPATGRIKNANSTNLIGRALDRDLAAALGREVRIANDANCFALSEAVDGAGAGAGVVFGVIVGTGTGGGVVVRGRVLTGPNAIAGEWGHNPLPWPREGEWPGPRCYCGRRGCIETFLSGPGLARDYAERAGAERAGAERAGAERAGVARDARGMAAPRDARGMAAPREARGMAAPRDARGMAAPRDARAAAEAREARDVVALAAAGDRIAAGALSDYEERMARALAHVVNILDPDVIVLGGGMSAVQRLYRNVPRLWGGHVFSDRVDTRLEPPRHGAESGVRGAAWLWPPGAGTR